MDQDSLKTCLNVCSICLARTYTRNAYNASIVGYPRKYDSFSQAIAKFTAAYIAQTKRDYNQLVKAVNSSQLPNETGI